MDNRTSLYYAGKKGLLNHWLLDLIKASDSVLVYNLSGYEGSEECKTHCN